MARKEAIDCTKSLMIFLVVFGHLIEPLIGENECLKVLYLSIYSYHMPVFVILSGMLSKSELNTLRIRKTVKSILIPLLSFTFLYELSHLYFSAEVSSYTVNFQPYWILWFLFSLFLWKMFLPTVNKLRYPIVTSIACSLIAGCFDSIGYVWGISRTLYFFPFFLFGYQLSNSKSLSETLGKIPNFIYVVLIFANLVTFVFLRKIRPEMLYGSYSYAKLNFPIEQGVLMRAFFYVISFVTAVAFVKVSTGKKFRVTRWGENSLYVYVWHGFFVKMAMEMGFVDYLEEASTSFALVVTALIALALTTLLSSAIVKTLTQKLILEPANRVLLIW